MAKKFREKPAPEIVSGLLLQEMAYGGEVVARLPEKFRPRRVHYGTR